VILVVHAHPYPRRSRANRALVDAVREMPTVEVRSLYDLYPGFDIDTAAEQRALEEAKLVVLLHPLYWYTTPALLKHWFDVVLVKGWAFGDGGTALEGKDCLWAVTTGGDEQAFGTEGRHHQPLAAFAPVVEQTMRFCGMRWQEPFVVHGAHLIPDAEMQAAATRFRARLQELSV
jgi:glutathione-regulated potassium-efflux system ancillary protein KefF